MAKWVFDQWDNVMEYPTLGIIAEPGDILDALMAPDARWSLNADQGAVETVYRYAVGGDPNYIEPTDGHVLTYSATENTYVPTAPESVGLPSVDAHVADKIDNPLSATSIALAATIEAATRQTVLALTAGTGAAAANTAAIQSALDDASAAYLAGSGVTRLVIPEGTWWIQRTATPAASYSLNVPSGVELAGVGEGKSILKVMAFNLDNAFTVSGYETTGYYQSVLYVKGVLGTLRRDIHLHDFTIDGNLSNATGTGTGNANTGDSVDITYCDPSVVVERVTVIDSTSDAFDIDDSTGVTLRYCTATGARGWGFHNSENAVGTVQIGNYAEGCGLTGSVNRGGFDQHTTAIDGVYLGCVSKDNYQNFGLAVGSSGATITGCVSLGTTTIADELLGADFVSDPKNPAELHLRGANAKIRFSDQADSSLSKRWNFQVAGGQFQLFSTTFGNNALAVSNTGNLHVAAMASSGGAAKAILIPNGTPPASTPSGGGVLYVEAGALKYRGSGGTITTLGPA